MRPLIFLCSALLILNACMSRPPAKPAPSKQTVNQTDAPAGQVAQPVERQPVVALLLPLSGANAALGQNLLQAAQLALFDNPSGNLQLIPIDSAAAGQPVSEALTRGAGTIVGPVFAPEAKALSKSAQDGHIKMFALTNDSSAAAPGVYVMGITPESQIRHVLDYASTQGIKNFAALLPDNPFGRLALAEMQNKVQKGEANLIETVFYPSNALDYTPYVQKLVDRYKAQTFEALLLPDGGNRGKAMAALVRTLGLSQEQVRLLGSALWQDNATDPAFAGGWFSASSPEHLKTFMSRYQQNFSTAPDSRGLIIYDAISLLAAINHHQPSVEELENGDGFKGLSGLFRLTASGKVERRLPILEAQPDGILIKDSGPDNFAPIIN